MIFGGFLPACATIPPLGHGRSEKQPAAGLARTSLAINTHSRVSITPRHAGFLRLWFWRPGVSEPRDRPDNQPSKEQGRLSRGAGQ